MIHALVRANTSWLKLPFLTLRRKAGSNTLALLVVLSNLLRDRQIQLCTTGFQIWQRIWTPRPGGQASRPVIEMDDAAAAARELSRRSEMRRLLIGLIDR